MKLKFIVMLFFNSNSEYNSVTQKNFILNLFDGALFLFGMTFVSMVTILPVYLKQIGGSNIAIGLIPVVWALGFNFPQIIIANFTGNQPYKKKIVLVTALFQRLPWLLLAFISLLNTYSVGLNYGVALFFITLGLAAIGGGINLPAWFDLIAKLTPVKIRGKQFAFRLTLGSFMGILSGWLSIEILDRVKFPNNFSILFFIGFSIMMSSYWFLIRIVEDTPNPPRKKLNTLEFLNKLPLVLKQEKNYKNFLIADVLLIVAMISNAFIAVYAIEKFNLVNSYVGVFTIIVMLSLMIGSLIFGMMADRFGHRLNMLLASIFTFIACFSAIYANNIYSYFAVFIFSSLVTGIINVSRLPLISELCEEKDRPTFVSLSNLITIPFVLSGIFAGWFVEIWGYESVFKITGIIALASAMWILISVKEPRKKQCRRT